MKRKFYLSLAFSLALFVSSYASNETLATQVMQDESSPVVESLSESMLTLSQAKAKQGGGAQKPAAKKPVAKKPVAKKPAAKKTAQSESKFGYGFKMGANFCNLAEDTKLRASFAVGLFGDYKITDKWSVSLETIYSEQGGQTEMIPASDGKGAALRVHTGLHYINVPLFVEYEVIDRLVIKTGFQYGFLVRAMRHERNKTRTTRETIDRDVTDYESYDLAIPFALTYSFNSGIFVEARYTHGLVDVTVDSNTLWNEPDYKNRTIMIGAGFKF